MNPFNSLSRCGFAAAALLFSLSAQANEQRTPEIVVTATRTEIDIDDALASVSVIDRAAIESHGAVDVLTLLRGEPGIDIVRGGGLGQQTSVFMRGSNSNHLLVLVDGVRVASATTGGYPWEQLPLAQIERIEIVRGPRAALFGSDAIGGVIQIFTRRPDGVSAMVGRGRYDTTLAEAAYGQRSERGGFGLRAAYTDSAGFSSQNENGFAFDPDRDGYRQESVAADARLNGESMRLQTRFLHHRSDFEFDQGTSEGRQTSVNTTLSGGDTNPWQIALSHHRDDLETPDFFSRFETRRLQLEAQQVFALGARGQWLTGISASNDDGASFDTFSGTTAYDDSRRQRAVFTSWRDGRAAWQWELGARYDHYDSFGGETSLQGGLGWQVADLLRLRASAAEGFRAPTLNELASPGFGGLFAGNPALEPERSRNLELGADWQFEQATVSLAAYRNRVTDLIDFSGGDTFQAINIKRAELRGIELSAQVKLDQWQLAGNLGWQSARDVDTDTELVRRPARKATLTLERPFGALRYGVELHAVSGRPEFGGQLPGYGLFGAWLSWPVANSLSVDVRLDNAFDRDYTLINGFNTAGRTWTAQLRWSPAQ